ncbi:DUF7706 family protein [Reyranella sp.]|uniref:DUF7706 family protein n=1 Tax=Reyranella sp. TaxID=1929291 RepID=UPI003D105F50
MSITFAVTLEEHQAQALAQLAKRFGLHHAKALSSEFTRYGAEAEHDVMIDAVIALGRALADNGFRPR